ncbi:ParE toxin of type II toxin-antitoxin system, parDE [Nocardioides psychrotolerans]|uniref:ParE toxin of type II toxin-antitoxin system, parDE n=1 Tax=Nocardioides psychrotolerans TaxID=1005945 RepID=A0A1I3IRX4_9ACTN|nr:ParE toxin of type II toxin-antitoxin system, parDE [Nocardioides psychrotolerans]
MTLRPVVFHPGVEDDLASIYEHYEAFDSSLPGRFEARLDDQVERIEMFPESGAVLFEPYRRVLLKRFPYMAVYVVRNDRIDVLAVIGVRRDPESIEAAVSGRGDE